MGGEVGHKRAHSAAPPAGERFRRIDEDAVQYEDNRLRDMRTKWEEGEFGAQAEAELALTRGKTWKAQMTKRKKQSSAGGKFLDSGVSSRVFEFDDSD